MEMQINTALNFRLHQKLRFIAEKIASHSYHWKAFLVVNYTCTYATLTNLWSSKAKLQTIMVWK